MTRLRQIPRAEVTSPAVMSMYQRLFGDRDPVAEPGTATGTPGDWWSVFANSPDVLEHAARGFGLYASPDRKVPGELRELGQTRAGWLVGSQFVFSQHCKACRGYGFSDEKIEALKAWAVSDLFSPVERALLAYTDALVLGFGRVDEAIFDAMRDHLERRGDHRVHLHHDDVHDARRHLPRAAPRVRRPRRSDRRDRRTRGTTCRRTSGARSPTGWSRRRQTDE